MATKKQKNPTKKPSGKKSKKDSSSQSPSSSHIVEDEVGEENDYPWPGTIVPSNGKEEGESGVEEEPSCGTVQVRSTSFDGSLVSQFALPKFVMGPRTYANAPAKIIEKRLIVLIFEPPSKDKLSVYEKLLAIAVKRDIIDLEFIFQEGEVIWKIKAPTVYAVDFGSVQVGPNGECQASEIEVNVNYEGISVNGVDLWTHD